jgi:mannose-6-phosphate isomerase-like protein (cupin superfamily)
MTYRRIVTGHDEEGKSIVVSDGPPGNERGNLFEMWNTASTPADNADPRDAAAQRDVILEPELDGTVFRFFEIAPESTLPSVEDRRKAAEERLARLDDAQREAALRIRPDTSRHPAMHRTRTVDYIVLLRGEVTMLLDEGEVHMKPFDVVIQRGTNHAWVNHGDESAVLVGVLVDAEPLAGQ